MAYFRHAAHCITDSDVLPFSATDYSQFKFGNTDIARVFGYEMAQHFINTHKKILLEQPEIVILSSPYNSIPTASYYLCHYFKQAINTFLYENNKKAAMDSKIHRYKTYSIDYGNLDFEARQQLISTDKYHLDSLFLENRLCLFVDDIKITGSHEIVIKKQIIAHQLEGKGLFGFVYFAELVAQNIPPQYENALNYAYVKSLREIVEMIQLPHFQYNTRIIKYILNAPDIQLFLEKVDKKKQETLYHWAISNNYHQMKEYQKNLQKIKNHL